MCAVARASAIAMVLLAAGIRAQTQPAGAAPRAQALLSRVSAGQEASVPCSELDEPLGKELVRLADEAQSVDRSTLAWRLAERTGRCAGADAVLGAALNGLSNSLMGSGMFSEALSTAQESVRVHERLQGPGLSKAWAAAGNAHWWLNDNRAALDDFQRALDVATAAGDKVGQARAYNDIANVHKGVGELDIAFDSYTRALGILEELGDRIRAAVVINNIGVLYFNRGEYATALEYNRRGLEMNRELRQQSRVAASLDSAGNIYRALGSYRLALQSFQEALAIRTSVGDKPGRMETSLNIGQVYFSQGDYELAIDAFKRGLHLNRELGSYDWTVVAEGLRNIGAAAWRLGQHQRAVANFREALVIARREHIRVTEGQILHDLGQAALAQGLLQEASDVFSQALKFRKSLGDQSGVTEALTALGSTRLAEHRYDEALDLARQAVNNARGHDQPELLWQAQSVEGIACRRLHRVEDARQALTAAIASIEALAAQTVGSENLRQEFLENKLSPYHELIALLIEERSFPQALELAERSKARVLTQLLRGNSAAEEGILTADEKRDRTRRRDALYTLNRQLEAERQKPSSDATRLNTVESARHVARDDLAAFEASLAVRHIELAARRGDVRPLTFADLSRLLTDRDTAMVEYVVADQELFALVVTTDGARPTVVGCPIRVASVQLASRIERFRERISKRDFGVAEDARALYDILLAPIRRQIAGKSRIVIVPDAALWNVPFQALRSPTSYLIESTAVSYVPSLTALREILQLRRPARPRTLLAIGKSDFGPASQTGVSALPEAESQIRIIRDLYGPERSVAFIGEEATESQFKAAAPRYSVLHLATHGVLDESSPLYSYFALSPSRLHPEDDGRLEAWEIMRMKLSAELVVLAACDSGRGRISPGEGLIGTTWALFAAGARSVVVSQFPVESKSASALLVGFHRRLTAGSGSKSAELQAAAIELLRTPRYAHPYYWAGFILAGDAD